MLIIWDADAGSSITSMVGHTDSVLCIDWCAKNSKLISGSDDIFCRCMGDKGAVRSFYFF